MAWLFIDTTRPEQFRYGLIAPDATRVRSVRKRVRTLLVELQRNAPVSTLMRCQGICVVHGPGSFSSVRGGVLVANLLARLLRKPLVGVSREESEDLNQLVTDLDAGQKETSAYVMPTYDAEPNITISSCPR